MQLDINGRTVEADAAPDTPLLWVLRDTLGMTGTKFGCGMAQCGACTVHVDGTPTRSCTTSGSRPKRSPRSQGKARALRPVSGRPCRPESVDSTVP